MDDNVFKAIIILYMIIVLMLLIEFLNRSKHIKIESDLMDEERLNIDTIKDYVLNDDTISIFIVSDTDDNHTTVKYSSAEAAKKGMVALDKALNIKTVKVN